MAGCLLTLSGCTTLIDAVANRTLLPNNGIRPATYDTWLERGVTFSTHDGIALVADVHHPKDADKTPTILVRIPFTYTWANRIKSDVIGRYWAKRGYTVVIQGTRGRSNSGGAFYPLIHERRDGLETLAWLKKQPWYDGRVAMWGGSAFGHTQWAIADQKGDPDVYFIQIASTNFREMFHPGGAFSLESAVYWAIRSHGNHDRDVSLRELGTGVNTLPLIQADDAAIGDTDFYNDWLNHPQQDEYWATIDGTDRNQHIRAPVLLMAGWYDPFLPTMLKDFTQIAVSSDKHVANESRLIVGPWAHAVSVTLPGGTMPDSYRSASLAPSIPWFDYQLGVDKTRELDMPRVKLFVMGKNVWRSENEWPLKRTRYTRYYLHSSGSAHKTDDGMLDTATPVSREAFDHYTYDPEKPVPTAGGAMLGERAGPKLQNSVEARPDVLVYSSEPLVEDLEVTGPVELILHVSTDAVSTDFTAKLVDVYPDGSAYNLSAGILRKRYEVGGRDHRSEVRQIRIALWPTSNVFLKGHRIRLEVSSSNFPRYDRNLNTGEPAPTAVRSVKAHQRVFHLPEYPSYLVLPVIPQN